MRLIILFFCLSMVACGAVKKIDFCYNDEGKQYCGGVQFNEEQSNKDGSLTLEDENGNILKTFTEEQIEKIAEKIKGGEASISAKTTKQSYHYILSKIKD